MCGVCGCGEGETRIETADGKKVNGEPTIMATAMITITATIITRMTITIITTMTTITAIRTTTPAS